MKKQLILSAMVMAATMSVQAQKAGNALSPLLEKYYAVKNALVSGDATAAAKLAADFSTTVSAIEFKSSNTAETTVFKSVQPRLIAESKNISVAKEIAKQRESFSKLSQEMITLAKGTKLVAEPIYVEYCPMKKASWLSSEQAIKNPYYGSAMLTCGKVTDTIQ